MLLIIQPISGQLFSDKGMFDAEQIYCKNRESEDSKSNDSKSNAE